MNIELNLKLQEIERQQVIDREMERLREIGLEATPGKRFAQRRLEIARIQLRHVREMKEEKWT